MICSARSSSERPMSGPRFLRLRAPARTTCGREVDGYTLASETKDRAFEWLEKSVDEREYQMMNLKVDPGFDSLRSDPRFDKLLRRVGLLE